MTATAAIEGLQLSKRYGGVRALADVSVAAHAGKVLGVLGENGAGKSTLVKILSGLERPDDGRVLVSNREVVFHVPRDAQRAGIRIAPQELLLYPELSVSENLLMGELPQRRSGMVDWRRAHREAESRLSFLGLDHLDVRAQLATLSVVERAFVQLARVLDKDTKVMILDEPTAPMNGAEVEQTLSVLRRVKSTGVAIIYISHRLQEVFEICDSIVVLRDGRLVSSFEREALDHDSIVAAMVSGRSLEFERQTATSEGNDKPLLQATDLRAERVSVDSLEIYPGEIVSVYGALGSGREAIARVLMGLTGSVGSLRAFGHPLSRVTPARVVRAGIGYVPAERRSQGLALELSVRENLTLGSLGALSRLGVLQRRADRAMARRWCELLQITAPSIEAPVARLSGGSQQKVLLARWLAAGSKLLVLEEPTRGVDIATKAEIYRVLRHHSEEGGATLVVSSDLEEVARISDRVLVMRDGSIVGSVASGSEAAIAAAALAA